MSRKTYSGFTLIELIVVIVLLGILSAVAIPKFINLTEEALKASNESIAGSFRGAIYGAHLAWIIHGKSAAIADMPNYLDNSFNFNSFGYPIESGDKLTYGHNVIGTENANVCARLWNSLLNHNVLLDQSGLGGPGLYY